MKLHTDKGYIEFTLENQLSLNASPKLYLDSLTLTFSIFDTYQQAFNDNSLFGAHRWLELDEDLDVLLFSSIDSLLVTLELGLTYSIKIEARQFQFIDSYVQGRVKAIDIDHFWLNQSKDVRYYEKNDFIIWYYSHYDEDMSIKGYKLANNFFIFLQNDIIIGWGLEKCTEYLYNRTQKSYDTPKKNIKFLLVEFFQLINKGVFEKMNSKDLIVKNEIVELLTLAKNKKAFSICDAITQWLEDNY